MTRIITNIIMLAVNHLCHCHHHHHYYHIVNVVSLQIEEYLHQTFSARLQNLFKKWNKKLFCFVWHRRSDSTASLHSRNERNRSPREQIKQLICYRHGSDRLAPLGAASAGDANDESSLCCCWRCCCCSCWCCREGEEFWELLAGVDDESKADGGWNLP